MIEQTSRRLKGDFQRDAISLGEAHERPDDVVVSFLVSRDEMFLFATLSFSIHQKQFTILDQISQPQWRTRLRMSQRTSSEKYRNSLLMR